VADSRSQPHAITAAILAGGRARRLNGADKSALLIGGERTIDRQLTILRSITDSIIIVGGDPGRAATPGVPVVADLVQGAGALGGIYSALAQSPHPRTLIVACDMPFLNGVFLERLVRPAPPPIDVVMPRTADGLEPLCAVYATRVADLVRRRIDRGMLKVIDLVEEVNLDEIGPEELAKYDPAGLMFVNVNTPHDFERAKEMVERPEGTKAHGITAVQGPRSQETNPQRP
jgi:molybdopterin-guanine dinucleotide biosynthesis protein A